MRFIFSKGFLSAVKAAFLVSLLAACVSLPTLGTQAPSPAKAPPPLDEQDRYYFCPKAVLRPNQEAVQSGGASLSWQAAIHTVARERRISGTSASLSVGLKGRFVLGPSGRAPLSTPLTVHIEAVRDNGTVLYKKAHRITASIPSGQTSNQFLFVDDAVNFGISATESLADVTVYVSLAR